MANKLTPPPPTGTVLDRWLALLYQNLTAAGQILWASIGKAGSNITDIETRLRSDMQGTQAATTVELDRIGSSTYSTLQDLQNIFHSTGWVTGGTVSDNGNGTVAVTAGTGVIRATDSAIAAIKFFDFAANASVSLTNLSINWVYIDYNAGAPAVTVSTTEPANHHTMIKLAEIYRNGTELHINQTVRYEIGDHAANMVRQMQETMPYAHVTGAMMAETGTRNLSITAGVFWNGLSRFTTAALNTAVSGSFSTFHRNGAGGWTETPGQTQVDNTSYDDGDGTLGALTSNRYTNRWIYLATDGDVHIVYGQAQHVLLADVQDEGPPSSLPAEITTDSFLIGRIVVRQGTATFIQVDSAFDMAFNMASVNTHNDLSGLQGGTAAEYYHLTSAQHSGLTGGGATTLHSHTGGSGIGANLIINGDFRINQRAYASGAAVGAGLYGHDRWKMAASGDTYTFSTTANKTTVTIPAGKVLRQVIEGLNLQTGTYCLSWEGTAQGKIGAGSLSASGVTGSITGGTDTTIEFGPGTVANVKIEAGSAATTFVNASFTESLLACARYFFIYRAGTAFGQFATAGVVSATSANAMLITLVPMRTSPALAASGSFAVFTTSGFSVTVSIASYNGSAAGLNLSGTGLPSGAAATLAANSDASAFISLSAEL